MRRLDNGGGRTGSRWLPALLVLGICLASCGLGAVLGLVLFGMDPGTAAAQGAEALDGGGGQFAPLGQAVGGVTALVVSAVSAVVGALVGLVGGLVVSVGWLIWRGGATRPELDDEPAVS